MLTRGEWREGPGEREQGKLKRRQSEGCDGVGVAGRPAWSATAVLLVGGSVCGGGVNVGVDGVGGTPAIRGGGGTTGRAPAVRDESVGRGR